MKTKLFLLFIFFIISCSSTESSRKISASGDPEDIFFEKDAPLKNKDRDDKDFSTRPDKKDRLTRSMDDDLDDVPGEKSSKNQDKGSDGSFDEIGYSSWYGKQFHGKPTASGELYDRYKLTAAHKTLPLGTVLKVQNLDNKKEAIVTVNDRGPFIEGRIIDVSEKTAEILNFKNSGVARVGITVVKKADQKTSDDDDELDEKTSKDETTGNLDEEDEEPVDEALKPVKNKKHKTKNLKKKETGGKYTIQVGVFKDQERAAKLQKSIKSEFGERVNIIKKNGSFIVQVGNFGTKEKAESMKQQLKDSGIEGFIPRK